MKMTYRQIRDYLNNLDEEQLDTDVTIYLSSDDEFYAIDTFIGKWNELSLGKELGDGILDDNHPFFVLGEPDRGGLI